MTDDANHDPARAARKAAPLPLESYPLRKLETIRYADTDRQGHVNNAVFATLCESGRVAFLYDPEAPLAPAGAEFVIARLLIDFLAEIRWPGEVEIGTMIAAIGRSSVSLRQGLFQNGRPVATAETTIVLMDEVTRRSRALPEATIAALRALAPLD
jgi:acyl-CoA thioester hydrolase